MLPEKAEIYGILRRCMMKADEGLGMVYGGGSLGLCYCSRGSYTFYYERPRLQRERTTYFGGTLGRPQASPPTHSIRCYRSHQSYRRDARSSGPSSRTLGGSLRSMPW